MVIPILYSTGCPKCKTLERKLDSKRINYEIENDIDVMGHLGLTEVPALMVDDKLLNFSEAIKWVNEQDGGKDY